MSHYEGNQVAKFLKTLEQDQDPVIRNYARGSRADPSIIQADNSSYIYSNVPAASPWKQSVCLLDLATPMNGFAWLFKPLVQDGQVYTVALGVQEWGLPEDSLQLVRVPLGGGPPSFLGRTKFSVINADNRRDFLARRLAHNTNSMSGSYFFVHGACVGAGFYFAATGSGVLIFPTNGGPVLQLNMTNGLPSDDVHAVAFLDGKLYIGTGEIGRGGYLVAYEPSTSKVTILASSRRSEHLSPLDDQPSFFTLGLTADPIRHRLLIGLTTDFDPGTHPDPTTPVRHIITSCMGIWIYVPASGEFKQAAPLFMPTYDPKAWRYWTWFGLADANTVVVKELYMTALFDLQNDRLISAYDSRMARTNAAANAAIKLWRRPAPGLAGPFFLRDGWFYSAGPLERMALADGTREELPPLRSDYPFVPRESLQLLDDGKHVLAADQISLWLLELKPEPRSTLTNNAVVKSP